MQVWLDPFDLLSGYKAGRRLGIPMFYSVDFVILIPLVFTMVLLIIARAGALKQVLVARGLSDYIAGLLKGSAISPLLLAQGITAIIRVCIGSAMVAGLTAAGIVMPVIGETGVSLELMVLAIGSDSLIWNN